MAFGLEPLQPEDIPRCVTIYFNAFQNAHSLGCWPRVPGVRAWWEKMIYDELNEPGAHWLKAVSKTTGELAGYVKWQEPKPGKEPEVELPEWPKEADQDLCNETFGAWARMHRELLGSRGHWYLEMLATEPAYQGKGAGSQMMSWGLQQADEQGVEAYLEASPEAVPLYEKYGFREAGRTDTFIENERVVKGMWYRNLFMMRPAKDHSHTR